MWTVDRNARDVGSIPALGILFPIFITPTTDTNYKQIAYFYSANSTIQQLVIKALHIINEWER